MGWGGVGWFFLLDVAFLEDPSETKIKNHSHEIRLEKLVYMLFTRYIFSLTRYQNIEKPLKKTNVGPIWPGHPPESSRIPMNSYGGGEGGGGDKNL